MPDHSSVERTIHFYRIDAGTDNAGRPVLFDPAPALEHINQLSGTEDGLYWIDASGDGTFVLPRRLEPPQQLIIYRSRRTNLPQIDRAATLHPLQLPNEGGLSEGVHVVLFPNNIAGADFNFYGPRISRLAAYLRIKAEEQAPPLTFEPLMRTDVEQQVRRMPGLALFRLRVKRAYAEEVRSINESLGDALRSALELGGAEQIELVLQPRPHARGHMGGRIKEVALQLLRLDSLREAATTFKVRGYDPQTDRVEIVDLLKDHLVARRRIVKQDPDSRALRPESAFAAISEAYRDLGDEISQAPGVHV